MLASLLEALEGILEACRHYGGILEASFTSPGIFCSTPLGSFWKLFRWFWWTVGDLLGTPGGVVSPPGGFMETPLSHWRLPEGGTWSPDRQKR